MKFEPKPDSTFPEFIDTYYEHCRVACPKLLAIAGKWTFDDLIPGLSDFDTRFIFEDDTTVDDWINMSLEVGQVHTKLAQQRPEWARILEHLPGLDLTHSEVIDPAFYYPEFQQWTYYKGDGAVLQSITGYLEGKPWNKRDELFFLKKFALYCGPYIRGIDPPVNMGKWESKYPLHSRFMHYFTPPAQAAVSIMQQHGQRGKFEALRKAREMFGHPEVIDMILDSVERHYEIPEYYQEPKITEIDRDLENYLQDAYATLADKVTLMEISSADSPTDIKAKVKAIPVDPVERFFEGIRFCRFMKGRLLFYATDIAWFDTKWLIHNELNRMVGNFCELPLVSFGAIRFGEQLTPEQVLDRLSGNLLTPEICQAVKDFMRICGAPVTDGQEKARAKEVADVFEPVQIMVETLSEEMRSEIKDS